MISTNRVRRGGFTLIELMVAVAIIGLLVGLLIPGFKAVTTNAKNVATTTRFAVLEQGLESYHTERALGGTYPPSRSDDTRSPFFVLNIVSPLPAPSDMEVLGMSGANLLVYAMVGADQMGTPGFPDLDGDGEWWDDQGSAIGGGAYEIDLASPSLDPKQPRYPGNNATYVDEATAAGIRTLQELEDDKVMVGQPNMLPNGVSVQPVFTDAWNRPILYYRATRGARYMVTEPSGESIGSYDSRDNTIFTGSTFFTQLPGIDWGAGQIPDTNGTYSRIGKTTYPDAYPLLDTNGVHDILVSSTYENTFERFILDPKVKQRNQAVNPNTYLLISAGSDGVYGTADDLTNWTRD